MKSCPSCNRTYPDDTLAFCLMDGAVLSAPYDPSETRAPPRRSNEPPPTEVISAPAKPSATRASLQSTIRAPVPQVPDLRQPTVASSKQSEVTMALPLLFRLPLAARELLAVVCILPWIFVSGWGRPWNVFYPPLAGALAIAAGTCLYARHKTGWLLIIEGIVAVLAGIAILMASSWGYWHSSWSILSGLLTIAAAWELRKNFTQTWVLALAGLIFATYTLGTFAKYLLYSPLTNFDTSRYSAFVAVVYLQAGAVFLSGITLTAFSFLARGKQLPDSN
jgi:hypothetical protein